MPISISSSASHGRAHAAKSQSGNLCRAISHRVTLQPEAWLIQMKAMYGIFENATGKVFSAPAVGKDREKMELLSKCAKAMSPFAANNIEYQQMMQITGQEAMQDCG